MGSLVLGLAHDVVLAAGEVGESALEPVSFGLSLTGLAVVDGGEISFEEVVLGERLVDPPPSRGTGMSNRS